MRIGILEAGRVPDDLVARHGTYPVIFERLIGGVAPDFGFASYPVLDGRLPESVEMCDAWLVTGSKHGVYDNLPWMDPLRSFLARARASARPVVGICFGHQILAEALGGAAAKSDDGWGLGLRQYHVRHRPGWMADAPDRIAIHAMHQDQVTEIPDDATVLAGNDHCPYAMLAYGDPELPDAISIQPHPEFTLEYTRDLIVTRTGTSFAPDVAEEARLTLGSETNAQDFARWCVAYLRRFGEARRAA